VCFLQRSDRGVPLVVGRWLIRSVGWGQFVCDHKSKLVGGCASVWTTLRAWPYSKFHPPQQPLAPKKKKAPITNDTGDQR
jgi:hypothetical protein